MQASITSRVVVWAFMLLLRHCVVDGAIMGMLVRLVKLYFTINY